MAYTTIAKVREKNTLWATDPPDANITNFIAHADKKINAIARTTFTEEQASDSIIEGLSTYLAAIDCVAFNVSAFATNADAVATANFLYGMAKEDIDLLRDKRTVNQIQA